MASAWHGAVEIKGSVVSWNLQGEQWRIRRSDVDIDDLGPGLASLICCSVQASKLFLKSGGERDWNRPGNSKVLKEKLKLRAVATALKEVVCNLATSLACPCWGKYSYLFGVGLTTANTQCQPNRWVAKRSPSLLQASGSGSRGPRPSLCVGMESSSEPDGGDSPGGMGSFVKNLLEEDAYLV